MNYDAFMEPITWFLTGMEKHSDEAREELLGNIDNFIGSMAHHMSNMLTPSLQVAMNELRTMIIRDSLRERTTWLAV